ncbi:helix-turn-helix domain-containing protein [Nocardioides sp. Soil774]|uniref:helix-turn-helix domain-containing protein n=1 Tax=Nocardioides sp. Soil774 TaxID=1736408 RepID=UPI0019108910
MTTAADTFTAFLDTLAETLDLGSEERARRLHLSRSHLDHVVAAAGGEPPERMRRRLLLERAAHRLLATDQPVVDIAFEAGFGSTRRSPGRSRGSTAPPRAAGVSSRPGPGSRLRAACTSTHRAACGCPPGER